ncbi:minor capsid protein [Capybara microvirus Cap3_SP_535]|nr:minor capsid protein [Capybara microvirus Cap3_SP_535]
MSWLGDFVGGIAGDFLGGVLGSSTGKSNADYQVELQKDLVKYINENKHQWEVSDLKAAGLNPILSANSSGFGSATAAGVINANGTEGQLSSSLSSAQKIARMQNDTQIAINERNAGINEKNVDNEIHNRNLNTGASVAYYNEMIKKLETDRLNSVAITSADIDYKRNMAAAAQSSAAAAHRQADNVSFINAALAGKHKADTDYTKSKTFMQDLNNRVYQISQAPYLDAGKTVGYIDYGLNSLGKLANIVKPFSSSNTRSDIYYHWDK